MILSEGAGAVLLTREGAIALERVHPGGSFSRQREAAALKVLLHGRLLEILNLSVLDRTPRDALRLEIRGAVVQLLAEEKRLLTPRQTDQLIDDVLDEILGLGPGDLVDPDPEPEPFRILRRGQADLPEGRDVQQPEHQRRFGHRVVAR